jgi:nickel-dependent lactate racemase
MMPKFDLRYGDRILPFEYDSIRFEAIERKELQATPLTDVEIGAAFDAPIASTALDEILRPGESVLIVVSDATRASASAQIVNLLVRRIIEAGVAPNDIAILFATGIHRAVTAEEKRALLTPFIVQRIRTIDHDPTDKEQLASYGVTTRGTSVELNRALSEFNHTIITGAIGFHYFAGFTGGRKSICPGLGSSQTIRETHMLALDFEKGSRRQGVGLGVLEGNAVHEECEEIAAMVRISFAVNTVVNEEGQPLKVYAGDWKEAHRVGCLEYLKDRSVMVSQKRDLVVVSCGGLPYDINLIQAHKALEMASLACVEGGTIILLSECRDGLGRPDFLKWFDGGSAGELTRRLEREYEVNGQTAWSLLTKTERFNVFLMSSLPPEQVRQMNMIPMTDLDAVLSQSQHLQGHLMPHGASFLPLTVEPPKTLSDNGWDTRI